MATKTTMATNFKPETVKEVFSKVKGHSSIIKLAKQMDHGSVLINLSGRGDKDMDYVIEHYGIR